MSAGRRRSKDDEPSFAEAIGDVEPLADRNKHRGPPGSTTRPPPAARPVRFEFPDPEDRAVGFASGIQSSQFRRLRAGGIRPDRDVDLHGLRADPARGLLLDEICEAIAAGERCVRVVHGKGLRSKNEPVLRNALPEWLGDPRLEGRILAFAPAQPGDGGRGATYVLLRRR